MTRKHKRILIRIIASGVLLVLINILPVSGISKLIFSLLLYFLIGYDVLKRAVRGVINGQVFDENFLMTIATIGAFVLGIYTKSGDYNEAVAVMIFYQTGELFSAVAIRKSRKNIAELMDIRPDYVNVEINGELTKVMPETVMPDTIITVNPGEKIPIDGVIEEGMSNVDMVAITGESVPKRVTKGDEVVSGSVNLNRVLKIKTTKAYSESTASKILELVENASSKKSVSEKFISKFARYYTPIVCVLALMLAVAPSLLSYFSQGINVWHIWIYRALTFLVISCPCALVLSIPLTFFAGLGGISKKGILVKGSNYLEALGKVKTVVFDKTGTLTHGVFEVRKIVNTKIDKTKLLQYAAYAEAASNHPIAKSIISAYKKPVDINKVYDVEELAGYGLTAMVNGVPVAVGNIKLMEKLGISVLTCKEQGTLVYVAISNQYAGTIIISDRIKTNSRRTVSLLKAMGIAVHMFTGDSLSIAKSVSRSLEIENVSGELLPTDKYNLLEEILKENKGTTIFAGDGINDAPVLARADVGIAMGGVGSDAAIEAADVVLMDDDPLRIVNAIKHSKKIMNIVKQNIVFSLVAKVTCLVLVAMGIGNMWFGIFADVGVMVIAVLNAIRALKIR